MSEIQKEKLTGLYDMARKARANNDATTAKMYYDMILKEDPLNWEPVFYSVYYTYPTTKNAEIAAKVSEITNCLNTTLAAIDNIVDSNVKNNALMEVMNSVSDIGSFFFSASKSFYDSLPLMSKDLLAYLNRLTLIADLLFTMGDRLKSHGFTANANQLYKEAIAVLESEGVFRIPTNNTPSQYIPALNRMLAAADFIRQTEPSYLTKRENNQISRENKKGGCYVATCVYGSYDCPQVWTLRRYRDDILAAKWQGRAFIKVYYAVSPTLVKWFGKTKWFKKMWQGKLDRMVKTLQENGVESTPYQDKVW